MASSALTPLADAFVDKVAAKTAVVGVVGLGYVGLPLALAFHDAGLRCIGFDIDPVKIEALQGGRSYIGHIGADRIAGLNVSGRFEATADFARAGEADALLICVPTPLSRYRDPDMSFVEATARALGASLRRGQLVSLESTTYPMSTSDLLAPILEETSALTANADFAIAYSPEREDPGNERFGTADIPKIVGADDVDAQRMAVALYGTIVDQVVEVPNTRTAEAVKLTENIFRSVNIALVNELKMIFTRMDIDPFEVIDAAATKPFGFMPFYPGPGIGGHCIPVDPFYLTWKAREFGLHTRFIELAGEINNSMPEWVIARLIGALSERLGKAVKGSRLLVVGLAYKRNVDDVRESPSFALIEGLLARGAEVEYYDPHVPAVKMTRDHAELAGKRSIAWTSEALSRFDAALIATDHDNVDYHLLVETVPVVLDTRNAIGGDNGVRVIRG
ncbi:MAG: nucleotide sugar dehydrogenase [Pseudomonadota bacterium]